ncbi:MAG TPA: hypothetical protein DCE44_13835 [Verrucomicrobiales bacterium]|nr:hypothetical protein [Verrucomicrobiales bacterium]
MTTTHLLAGCAAIITVGAGRADFFNGNAEDIYTDSGSFSLTISHSGPRSLSIMTPTRSGQFPPGHDFGPEMWHLWLDTPRQYPPAPAPWETRLAENPFGSPLDLDYQIGTPIIGDDIQFVATFSETFTLGDYARTYWTVLRAPADISYDGNETFSMIGNWTYTSTLIEETGRRPDAVQDGGPTLPIAVASIVVLAGARVRRRKARPPQEGSIPSL